MHLPGELYIFGSLVVWVDFGGVEMEEREEGELAEVAVVIVVAVVVVVFAIEEEDNVRKEDEVERLKLLVGVPGSSNTGGEGTREKVLKVVSETYSPMSKSTRIEEGSKLRERKETVAYLGTVLI